MCKSKQHEMVISPTVQLNVYEARVKKATDELEEMLNQSDFLITSEVSAKIQQVINILSFNTFIDRYEQTTKGLKAISCGLCPNCETCASAYDLTVDELNQGIENCTLEDEGGFSHFTGGCDTCNSHLGGTTFAAHAISEGEIVHMESCRDCVMYMANGDLPDYE